MAVSPSDLRGLTGAFPNDISYLQRELGLLDWASISSTFPAFQTPSSCLKLILFHELVVVRLLCDQITLSNRERPIFCRLIILHQHIAAEPDNTVAAFQSSTLAGGNLAEYRFTRAQAPEHEQYLIEAITRKSQISSSGKLIAIPTIQWRLLTKPCIPGCGERPAIGGYCGVCSR